MLGPPAAFGLVIWGGGGALDVVLPTSSVSREGVTPRGEEEAPATGEPRQQVPLVAGSPEPQPSSRPATAGPCEKPPAQGERRGTNARSRPTGRDAPRTFAPARSSTCSSPQPRCLSSEANPAEVEGGGSYSRAGMRRKGKRKEIAQFALSLQRHKIAGQGAPVFRLELCLECPSSAWDTC